MDSVQEELREKVLTGYEVHDRAMQRHRPDCQRHRPRIEADLIRRIAKEDE